MSENTTQRTGLSLQDNIARFKAIFENDDTLKIRQFDNQFDPTIKCCVLFFDGMVNNDLINKNIVLAIQLAQGVCNDAQTLDVLQKKIISANEVDRFSDITKLVSQMLYGDTLVLLDGEEDGLIVSTKGFQTRSVAEPENEKALRGPRDGFGESIMTNISLLRRKLQTPTLKCKFRIVGSLSRTKVCICYLEGVAKPEIVNEVERRLDKVEFTGILDSNYIREHIREGGIGPFKSLGSTERPDIVAAKLLEGRIAIMVDGSPNVLTMPHVFLELFQSNEDYYTFFYYGSINRILRMMCFIFTITVPAVYLALITFHQELIPTPLLMSIASAQNAVPFPTIVELLILLFAFELLREAGARMPNNIAQALSIVGALVLGQAAVEAKLVSAPMVIVVALTSITGMMIPRMISTTILLRLITIFSAAIIGLYGVALVLLILFMYLLSLRSFGVEYLSTLSPPGAAAFKDTVFRFPWGSLRSRNLFKPSLGSDKGGEK